MQLCGWHYFSCLQLWFERSYMKIGTRIITGYLGGFQQTTRNETRKNVIFLYQVTSMNCCEQTSEGVKFGRVKNKTSWNPDRSKITFWLICFIKVQRSRLEAMLIVRACKLMTIESRGTLIKVFIESQFGYCPLVWVCCNRNCNNRINHLHERVQGIVYNDSLHLKIY